MNNIDLREEYYNKTYSLKSKWWMNWGIALVAVVVSMILVLGTIVSYPDTIKSEFKLSSQTPSVVLTVNNEKQIDQLFFKNNEMIAEGRPIVLYKNEADYEDVLQLEKDIRNLTLGNDKSIKHFFDNHVLKDRKLGETIHSKLIEFSRVLLKYNNAKKGARAKELSRKIAITESRQALLTSIAQWRDKNLVIAPITGKLTYIQDTKEGGFYEGNAFYISSEDQNYYASVRIPSRGAGKVKRSQSVILQLNDYPYKEFGVIKGSLDEFNSIPGEKFYLGKVHLINDESNYGKQFQLRENMTGVCKIITNERSVLERIFERITYALT